MLQFFISEIEREKESAERMMRVAALTMAERSSDPTSKAFTDERDEYNLYSSKHNELKLKYDIYRNFEFNSKRNEFMSFVERMEKTK